MIVDAVIEDPRGSTLRHVRDETSDAWRAFRHPLAVAPWPAAYGFLPGTRNPADGDPLDVLVLSSHPLTTGDELPVRPVGLIRRSDGDHKILAVDPADPALGRVTSLAAVPRHELETIAGWFRAWTTFDGWEDAPAAEKLIRENQCPR